MSDDLSQCVSMCVQDTNDSILDATTDDNTQNPDIYLVWPDSGKNPYGQH